MTLWGFCTLLHIWIRKRWQLVLLRVAIATLEAGFYPTTVSYLSLFYTRYEFAVRLGFFYGQSAVAGVVGGILSWAVFRQFPQQHGDNGVSSTGSGSTTASRWKSWEVLFVIEGCMTMAVALFGFVWLPHSADTAWFFTSEEREWAERRIRVDRNQAMHATTRRSEAIREESRLPSEIEDQPRHSFDNDQEAAEDHIHLLRAAPRRRKMSSVSNISLTADSGLSRQDIISAVAQYKIWHLLICNILSAIPATAFSVFLPMVMKQLSPRLNLTPAASNLLSAPPFAFGAVVLFLFMRWSDRIHRRLIPILWGLALLLIGLTLTVMTPVESYVLRYISLCVLLSGSFIASPLTVAWLTNNTPEPGKRAILLGINGWGNLAGVFSALLFTPDDEKDGYVRPFFATLVCVGLAFAGFVMFSMRLMRENEQRVGIVAEWSEEERQREELMGDVEARGTSTRTRTLWDGMGSSGVLHRFGLDGARRGDDKLTYQYGL
jgi:MFS family permease